MGNAFGKDEDEESEEPGRRDVKGRRGGQDFGDPRGSSGHVDRGDPVDRGSSVSRGGPVDRGDPIDRGSSVSRGAHGGPGGAVGEKRSKKCNQKRDLERPKRPMSPYNCFVQSRMADRRGRRQGFDFGQSMADLASEWKTMSDSDKQPYVRAAADDRRRFSQEKAQYEKDKKETIIKRPLNGYMVFMQDFRRKQKQNYPNPKDLVREGAKEWKRMSREQKQPFNNYSLGDSDRYAKERFQYCNKVVLPKRDDTRFEEGHAEAAAEDQEPTQMEIDDEKELQEWLRKSNPTPSSSSSSERGRSSMKRSIVGGIAPRIDMSHGFLKTIQKDLTARAAELNLIPARPNQQNGNKQEETLSAMNAGSAVQYRKSATTLQNPDAEVVPSTPEEMVEMAELSRYIPEAQRVIQMAIADPKQLSQTELNQVSKSLVERACEDFAYYDVAASLCGYICKNEEGKTDLNTIPDARFVRAVLEACNKRMSLAAQMRKADVRYFINFCLFLAGLYLQMSLHGGRLYELQCMMFKILDFLSHPPSVECPDEVNALAMVYRHCGQELCAAEPAAFDNLVCNLRDAFIKGTDAQSNTILLMLIELYSSNWSLSDVAKEHYGLL